jgi:hypothetical protein
MGSRATCLSSPLEHRVEFLSSLDGNAALLGSRGTIVAVNREWTHSGSENGAQRGSNGVGERGTLVFRCGYRCDGPQTLRWFLLTVEIQSRTLKHARAIIWAVDLPRSALPSCPAK